MPSSGPGDYKIYLTDAGVLTDHGYFRSATKHLAYVTCRHRNEYIECVVDHVFTFSEACSYKSAI